MELRNLETFRQLAKSLSFTRTAAERHYAQSTITAQIQALETELGVPLFDRLGRRVALTEAGRRLLPYAERLLELAAEAEAAIAEPVEVTGSLTFAAPDSVCTYRLPVLFHAVRAQYPGIRLSVRPLPAVTMLQALRTGAVDLAFMLDRPLQIRGLETLPLVSEPLLLLAPPEHHLAGRPVIEPDDLRDEPLLLTEAGCSYRTLFARELATAGVHPTTILELDSVEAIKQCVMAGMGLTLLPAMTVGTELAQGRLIALPWVATDPNFISQAAWHRERWQSLALRTVLALIRRLWAPLTNPADQQPRHTACDSQAYIAPRREL